MISLMHVPAGTSFLFCSASEGGAAGAVCLEQEHFAFEKGKTRGGGTGRMI